MNRYKTLLQAKADLAKEADALLAVVEPSAEQRSRMGEIIGALKETNAEIATLEALREEMRGGPTPAEQPLQTEEKASPIPTPYKAIGEQLADVARAAQNPFRTDHRLTDIQAASGSSEGVASDGGFLVQPDFEQELLVETYKTALLVGKTDRRPISANANGLKLNAVDETSRVDGSRYGGMLAYWTAEAAAFTATKPKFRQMELILQKLTGLYYATDEELKDITALGANITAWFAEEFGFKLDDALIRGGGAGMPLGVLGAPGTVSVAKEAGQTAATITKGNIEAMYARMRANSLSNAEWDINQDVWPALFGLSQIVGVGGVPVYIPAGGMSAAPYGTLLGRPIVPIEQAQTLGTVGDIIFADWNQYIMIEKGGIEAASSIHVQFLTDETVFRFILRTDGQPKRINTLTPFKGSKTLSSFVTLDTRA